MHRRGTLKRPLRVWRVNVFQQRCGEGEYLVGVSEQSQVGKGKDGCGTIRIDGDDGLCFAHAAGVLGRAGNATGDVQSRMNAFACRADLPRVLDPAVIGSNAGCPNCRAQQTSEGRDMREPFTPDASSARDNAFRRFEFDRFRRWGLDAKSVGCAPGPDVVGVQASNG